MAITLAKEPRTVHKDVVVVGGGTAGFVAAIAAARNGAAVLLIEQRDHLGGTHSGGMVMMIRSMRHMRAPTTFEQKKVMVTGYESSFDDEQLVRSIQARCGFAPGELRVVIIESQPLFAGTMAWRVVDAATGRVAAGESRIADMLQRQPWPTGAEAAALGGR